MAWAYRPPTCRSSSSLIQAVLRHELPEDCQEPTCGFVAEALRSLPEQSSDTQSYIDGDASLDLLAQSYLKSLLRGEHHAAAQLLLDALAGGASVEDLYLRVIQRTQYEIGRLWQINRITVGQEHYCTAASQRAMTQLYATFAGSEPGNRHMVMTCVAGELHEIGPRIVADLFELAGWDTFYLGANTPAASIVRLVAERGPDMLCISASMATQLPAAKALIATVRDDARCAGVKILVGGQPFKRSPDLWSRLGADGAAADARSALVLGERWFGSD